MKKILNHMVLAFIFITQTALLAGCAQHVKVFECKLDCNNGSQVECKTSVSGVELDLD